MAFRLRLRGSLSRIAEDVLQALSDIDKCDLVLSRETLRILVLAEDRRFHYHFGVDLLAICRAVFMRVRSGRLQGASTIEAQFVRTVCGRREITLRRKVRESICACIVSLQRPKDKIATAYLDCAHYGFARPGIRYAADVLAYDLGNLSVEEACELVARLKRPVSCGSRSESLRALQLRRRADWLRLRYLATRGSPKGARLPRKLGDGCSVDLSEI